MGSSLVKHDDEAQLGGIDFNDEELGITKTLVGYDVAFKMRAQIQGIAPSF